MDPQKLVALLQYMTGGVVLGLVVWAMIKGLLVPYKTYDMVLAERDDFKDRYFKKVDPDYKAPAK